MKARALVVEDQSGMMPPVEATLCSLGHEHVWVTNQHDARRALAGGDFDYMLLDLVIPAKPGRGGADKQFGLNLLKDIQRIKGPGRLPVIVMTAYPSVCVDMTADLVEAGACQFIAKPFENRGRELATAIERVLNRRGRPSVPSLRRDAAGPSRFEGGEMVFFPDRVELLGVKIITDRGPGVSVMVLRELSRKNANGRFVRRSAEDLVDVTGVVGAGTIIACIQTIRRNIVRRVRKAGIEVQSEDVIGHDEQGYYLRDWIVVRDARDGDVVAEVDDAPAEVTVASPSADSPPDELNSRRRWAITELRRGVRLNREMLERKFGIGPKTAKRDLVDLTSRGLITFVREGRGGFYESAG